jgi:hypothetical protein
MTSIEQRPFVEVALVINFEQSKLWAIILSLNCDSSRIADLRTY